MRVLILVIVGWPVHGYVDSLAHAINQYSCDPLPMLCIIIRAQKKNRNDLMTMIMFVHVPMRM